MQIETPTKYRAQTLAPYLEGLIIVVIVIIIILLCLYRGRLATIAGQMLLANNTSVHQEERTIGERTLE